MKKLVVLFSALFCFAMCSFGQTEEAAAPQSVSFEYTTYDYGQIQKGSDGKCSFKFTNNTDTPLILTNVVASCGCTVPSWPKTPINPGESNVINVKYNTNNVGHFTKRITVTTNKQDMSTIILTIKGQVTEATEVQNLETETK